MLSMRCGQTPLCWWSRQRPHDMSLKHGGQQVTQESVAQFRQLDRAARAICGTIRLQRENRCNHCMADTTTHTSLTPHSYLSHLSHLSHLTHLTLTTHTHYTFTLTVTLSHTLTHSYALTLASVEGRNTVLYECSGVEGGWLLPGFASLWLCNSCRAHGVSFMFFFFLTEGIICWCICQGPGTRRAGPTWGGESTSRPEGCFSSSDPLAQYGHQNGLCAGRVSESV